MNGVLGLAGVGRELYYQHIPVKEHENCTCVAHMDGITRIISQRCTAQEQLTLYSRTHCVPTMASIDTVGVSPQGRGNPEGVDRIDAQWAFSRCTFLHRIG